MSITEIAVSVNIADQRLVVWNIGTCSPDNLGSTTESDDRVDIYLVLHVGSEVDERAYICTDFESL